MKKLFLFIIGIFILISCNSSQSLDKSKNKITETPEKLTVSNLCVLLNNPYPYHQKIVNLKTILYRLASKTTLGDENCGTRHPVVDVEFSPKYEEKICNSKNEVDMKLCLIAKPNEQNSKDSEMEITANLTGYFELSFR